MARLAAGVVVVTSKAGEDYRGLTAGSLVSVSLAPPLVSVALDRNSTTLAAVLESRRFNVSVLARAQEFLADRFAGRAPSVDWRTLSHRMGANGIPLLEGCAAWLECRLVQSHEAGDHELCVGAVDAASVGSGEPLVLWDRAFWSLH